MSRTDYGAIAAIIAGQRCEQGTTIQAHVNAHIDGVVEELIEYFSGQNNKFDADRFRKATGMIVN